MNDCIFCKIIEGQVPSYKIYEDDKHIAILDITPVNQGHSLVITKKHAERIENLTDEETAELFKTVHKVIKLINKKLNTKSIKIVQNNGKEAGQLVNHVHVHIIPFNKDEHVNYPEHRKPTNEELKALANKLKMWRNEKN